MYSFFDDENVEMPHNGKPEDSAIYNPAKHELTCFYNGNIDDTFSVDSESHAENTLTKWLGRGD
jgi:hypothetical protein|tara:strand:- start:3786 stop:3977 length:192 start_codon:yes stop_codon:yes gene_type:complete